MTNKCQAIVMLRRVGVLLLDVSVKTEIIDFLLPRIKQKLCENIITLEKCAIGINYVQPSSWVMRMMRQACYGLGPFALDTVIKTMIKESFLEADISQGGCRGLGETSQDISPDKMDK